MINLPKELIDLIYEYDCTKKENFDKVIRELNEKIDRNRNSYLCEYLNFSLLDPIVDELEIKWVKWIDTGDDWIICKKYIGHIQILEQQLNNKLQDFLYHEFNEE